jgi:hypothetical protein
MKAPAKRGLSMSSEGDKRPFLAAPDL